MANLSRFPFVSPRPVGNVRRIAYIGPDVDDVTDDMVFPTRTVVVGPKLRASKFVGIRSDAVAYVGKLRLFP